MEKKKGKGLVIFSSVLILFIGALAGVGTYFMFFANHPAVKTVAGEVSEEEEVQNEENVLPLTKDFVGFTLQNTDYESITKVVNPSEISGDASDEDPYPVGDGEDEDGEPDAEGELDDEEDGEPDAEGEEEDDVFGVRSAPYICAFSSTSLLSDEDIDNIIDGITYRMPDDKSVPQMMINEIYARHGYRFKNNNIQSFFNEKEWYRRISNKSNDMDKIFKTLSETEKKNIKRLKDY